MWVISCETSHATIIMQKFVIVATACSHRPLIAVVQLHGVLSVIPLTCAEHPKPRPNKLDPVVVSVALGVQKCFWRCNSTA